MDQQNSPVDKVLITDEVPHPEEANCDGQHDDRVEAIVVNGEFNLSNGTNELEAQDSIVTSDLDRVEENADPEVGVENEGKDIECVQNPGVEELASMTAEGPNFVACPNENDIAAKANADESGHVLSKVCRDFFEKNGVNLETSTQREAIPAKKKVTWGSIYYGVDALAEAIETVMQKKGILRGSNSKEEQKQPEKLDDQLVTSKISTKDTDGNLEVEEEENKEVNNEVAQPNISVKHLKNIYEGMETARVRYGPQEPQPGPSRQASGKIFGGGRRVCPGCKKSAYPLESIDVNGVLYHKQCFRCTTCKTLLRLNSYASNNGVLFCKIHYVVNFKPTGNYQ